MTTEVASPDLLMWSAGQIAERDGVSREAVLKQARGYAETHGLSVSRDRRNRITLINVAAYDHLRGRYGDPSKAQAPARNALDLPNPERRDSYDEGMRQKVWQDVERRRLETGDLRKTLLRRDRYMEAVAQAGRGIALVIDLLPQEADNLAVALGLDEVHTLRVELRRIATELREAIAKKLDGMAAEAPPVDEDDKPTE